VRIIGGSLKGIILHPPKGLPVRPTTDRAKESLFNILENNFDLSQTEVLDLFSGTGNIALEFASRGAPEVAAVDLHGKCIAWIKEMATKHQFTKLLCSKSDAVSYLNKCTRTFDIIFADAPYAMKEIIQIPSIIHRNGLLKKGGWLIVEHESNLDLSHEIGFFDKRVYGQSAFSFFRYVPATPLKINQV
jgi:16S rRNA (guanine(966)-N(2))-methyltransferase RsmD